MGRRKKQGAVSASALSQMGVCERLVVFEYHEGKRLTLARKVAMQRGLHAHRRFASMGSVKVSGGDHYLSTRVASDQWEMSVSRGCRDEILRPTRPVRRLILGCYWVVLRVCRGMARWPVLQHVAQAALKAVMRVAMRALGAPGFGRVD